MSIFSYLASPCFQPLQTTSVLPQRWVMWLSHSYSGNPLNTAAHTSGWRICFLVWNTGSSLVRPPPTSPSFWAPFLQVQQSVGLRMCQVVSYLSTFAPRALPPSMPLSEHISVFQDRVQASHPKENRPGWDLPQRWGWGKSSPHSTHRIPSSGEGTTGVQRMRL